MMLISLLLVREVYDMDEIKLRKSTHRGTRYMSILIEVNQNAIQNAIEEDYIEKEKEKEGNLFTRTTKAN